MTLRTLGIIAGCVLLAFGFGWCVGASGRAAVSLELTRTALGADATEVRASLLGARVSLTQSNFGDARRSVQRAQEAATRVESRLRELGQADRAGAVQTVQAHLREADRLAAALDPGADQAVSQALRTLEASVVTSVP